MKQTIWAAIIGRMDEGRDEERDEERAGETGLFKQALRGHIAGERHMVENVGLTPQMALLRNWQVSRLAQTHGDLLKNPRYGRACQFFLTDIYGAQDFSQRDADAENVYNHMRKYLPERLLVTMGKAIALNKITEALDSQLLEALIAQTGMTNPPTGDQVAAAYRSCQNYDTRSRQIDLVLDVGRGVDHLSHIPLVGMALRAARTPANRTGWSELQNFMERGFAAFKQMKGANQFLTIVEQRERQILDQIFAATPNPFQLPL